MNYETFPEEKSIIESLLYLGTDVVQLIFSLIAA